jgi:hypothetical protein
MDNNAQQLKAYIETHPFNPGDSDCETVLDQLYQVYQESHESDPPDIRDSFRELDTLLERLSLDDNNAVFNLCCHLCAAYEHKAFSDGFHYGAQLIIELK